MFAQATTHWTSGRWQTARTWEDKRTLHPTGTHPHPPVLPFQRWGWHFVIWSKFEVVEFYSFSSPLIYNTIDHKTNLELPTYGSSILGANTTVEMHISFFYMCITWNNQNLHICDFALTLFCLESFSVLTVLNRQGASPCFHSLLT